MSYSSTLPPAPPAPAFFFTPTMRAPSHRYRRLEAVSGRSLPSVDSVVGHRKTDRCAGARTPAVRPGAGVRAGWTGWAAPKKSARAPTARVVENRPGGHRPNGFHYGVFSLRWHLAHLQAVTPAPMVPKPGRSASPAATHMLTLRSPPLHWPLYLSVCDSRQLAPPQKARQMQ